MCDGVYRLPGPVHLWYNIRMYRIVSALQWFVSMWEVLLLTCSTSCLIWSTSCPSYTDYPSLSHLTSPAVYCQLSLELYSQEIELFIKIFSLFIHQCDIGQPTRFQPAIFICAQYAATDSSNLNVLIAWNPTVPYVPTGAVVNNLTVCYSVRNLQQRATPGKMSIVRYVHPLLRSQAQWDRVGVPSDPPPLSSLT